MDNNRVLHGWGSCLDCGYEGMLEYSTLAGESYDDLQALGLMLLLSCPACESQEHALVTVEYFLEMSQQEEHD